jgi:putative transcriptional regulator
MFDILRLRRRAPRRDCTQDQLADALDVVRQTINAVETRSFNLSLPLAFGATRLFALRIEEIFNDEDRRNFETGL